MIARCYPTHGLDKANRVEIVDEIMMTACAKSWWKRGRRRDRPILHIPQFGMAKPRACMSSCGC